MFSSNGIKNQSPKGKLQYPISVTLMRKLLNLMFHAWVVYKYQELNNTKKPHFETTLLQ